MTATATATKGTIVQVIGPVIDVEFEPGQLPEIYNALVVVDDSGIVPVDLTAEVQQHIGRGVVPRRCEEVDRSFESVFHGRIGN